MNNLNEQGKKIVAAIEAGLAAMTPARWAEERENAAQYEDAGEWFALEFAAAREATKGMSWDFAGWAETRDYLTVGSGKIGGVSFLAVVR